MTIKTFKTPLLIWLSNSCCFANKLALKTYLVEQGLEENVPRKAITRLINMLGLKEV